MVNWTEIKREHKAGASIEELALVYDVSEEEVREHLKKKVARQAKSAKEKPAAKKLTPLQREVADAYLALSVSERSQAAAYRAIKPHTTDQTCWQEGRRILSLPHVSTYVERCEASIRAKISEKLEYGRNQVIERLIDVEEKARGVRPVNVTRAAKSDDGKESVETTQEYIFVPQAANKALELLGKELAGMWPNKLEVKGFDPADILEGHARVERAKKDERVTH